MQEIFIWGTYVLIIIAILFVMIDIVMLSYMVKGAPYLRTDEQNIEKICSTINQTSNIQAADIGSGDGCIVIALAKRGIHANGYEINPFLVRISRRNIRLAGVEHLAKIHWKNFWKTDFSHYDVITIFGVGYIMKRLEMKLQKELKPGAQVISLRFSFPTWPLQEKHDSLHIYTK